MNKSSENQYDIIIIGAGVSGLTSAALYSRFGYKVCVLEMDARPGGYIAGFNRLEYRFDSAIHWLNQCGKDGLVTQAFSFIGKDFPTTRTQHKIKSLVTEGYSISMTTDIDAFKKKLIHDFPEDKDGIERFIRDAKRIGKSFRDFKYINRNMSTMNLFEKVMRGLKMIRFVIPFIPHISYTGDKVEKGLRKYFSNPLLLGVFKSEPDLLSCLIPLAWASVQDYQVPPEGGSQTFAEWLAHVSKSFDNEIIYRAKVTNVLVKDKLAYGVEYTKNKETHQVFGKYIIAACDVQYLYEKLLPKSEENTNYLKKLDKSELYASAFTVALALDCTGEELGFDEEMLFISDGNLKRNQYSDGNPETTGIHVLSGSTKDKTMAPEGHGTLTIFIPTYIEQFDYWKTTTDKDKNYKRGEEYKDIKTKVAETIIKRIEKKLNIDIQSHIIYMDIATPITHYRYTGNKNGTMMGTRPGKANMQSKVAQYKTPIKNVYLSGHWAELGGGIPIAVRAALNSSLLVLKKDNKPAFRLLANYMDGKVKIDEVRKSALLLPYANDWKRNPTPAEKAKQKLK